ncbi:hypothetical protein PVAP13_2KG168300 [Panicum virgatum]|uniref:Uncharacterized protein n=1 Tax=Panicum virgatum TaxID=38727 RepID=A0A8T0W3L1_PANVG|nr:hypothetical protein PVAP13_2KG168300 [Panicum virgatum]
MGGHRSTASSSSCGSSSTTSSYPSSRATQSTVITRGTTTTTFAAGARRTAPPTMGARFMSRSSSAAARGHRPPPFVPGGIIRSQSLPRSVNYGSVGHQFIAARTWPAPSSSSTIPQGVGTGMSRRWMPAPPSFVPPLRTTYSTPLGPHPPTSVAGGLMAPARRSSSSSRGTDTTTTTSTSTRWSTVAVDGATTTSNARPPLTGVGSKVVPEATIRRSDLMRREEGSNQARAAWDVCRYYMEVYGQHNRVEIAPVDAIHPRRRQQQQTLPPPPAAAAAMMRSGGPHMSRAPCCRRRRDG